MLPREPSPYHKVKSADSLCPNATKTGAMQRCSATCPPDTAGAWIGKGNPSEVLPFITLDPLVLLTMEKEVRETHLKLNSYFYLQPFKIRAANKKDIFIMHKM